MWTEEQRRAMVLTRVVAGSLSMTEAATVLALSERSVWRLRRRFLADGPATRGQRGYAHRRVDIEVRLDGRLVAWSSGTGPASS